MTAAYTSSEAISLPRTMGENIFETVHSRIARPWLLYTSSSFPVDNQPIQTAIFFNVIGCNAFRNFFAEPFSAVLSYAYCIQYLVYVCTTIPVFFKFFLKFDSHFFILVLRIYIVIADVYHIYEICEASGQILQFSNLLWQMTEGVLFKTIGYRKVWIIHDVT